MTTFANQKFFKLYDRDSGASYNDIIFEKCLFDNCGLSFADEIKQMSTVSNVQLIDCTAFNSHIGPTVFENVHVCGLKNNYLLALRGVFRHVILEGRINSLAISRYFAMGDYSEEVQKDFDNFRKKYYQKIDWAIDISNAQFTGFEIEGIPARLIRRDTETQVVIQKKNVKKSDFSKFSNALKQTHWPFMISEFLDSDDEELILAAPKAASKKKYIKLLAGLNELRKLGIADPD